MLLTKLVLLSILNLGFHATTINGRSSDRSDTFKGSFSLRTSIEIYEGTKLERTIETHERYSQFEKRSEIHLKTAQVKSTKDQTSEVIYYYDRTLKSWLQYNDDHLCSESSQTTLIRHLFNEDIFEIWQQDEISENDLDHIVGVARLLSIVEQLRVDFKKAEYRRVRNLEAVVFKGQLKSRNIAYSDLRFEIVYSKAEMGKIFDSDVLPLHLTLDYEWPQEMSMIVIHFYGLKRVDTLNADLESTDFIHFPPASNCGYPIESFLTPDILERTQKLFSSVSFEAKLVGEDNNDKNIPLDDNIKIFYAFNMEARLMRKDMIKYGTLLEHQISSTIYDYNQNKKYNMFKNYKSSGETSEEASAIESIHPKISKCISSDISRRFNTDYNRFMKLDKLKYLGQTRVRGILSDIFEDDSIDLPPYWLFPSVLVKMNDKQTIEASEFDQLVGPTGSLVLVYYFASKLGSNHEKSFEKLLKIEIIVRDSRRKTLTLTKEIHIFNFMLGYFKENPIINDNEASTNNLFSLSRNCATNLETSMFADVAILFEPKEDNFSRENLALSTSRLFHRTNRDELILQALSNNFQLSRLYVDQIETRLGKYNSDTRDMASNGWSFPVLRLNMRVSNFDITSIDCIHLGRGRFLDKSNVMSSKVVTFEECLWFAYHHSRVINKEVVFAYHQTEKHINECLIDSLYSSNSRTNFTQTLGYYPYEYGENMMYKIHMNSAKKADSEFVGWPIIRTGVNYLIGQQISLPKIDQDEDLEIVYLLRQVKVSGELFKKERQFKTGERIDGIAWIQKIDDDLKDQNTFVKTIRAPSTAIIGTQDASIMTENLCQSICLLDLECKSYSFCRNHGSKRSFCSLSNIDIQLEDNFKSLRKASNMVINNQETSQLILIKDMGLQKRIEVRLDKGCSIFSKPYSILFRKDHTTNVNLGAYSDIIQVVDENDCARHCYEQNLSFLRGVIKQEIDIKLIYKDLEKLKIQNENSSIILGKLESIFDRYSKNVNNLCTTFQYANMLPAGNGSGTTTTCIISNNQQQRNIVTDSNLTSQQMPKMIIMTRYKLIETSFYEKMSGFRLLDISDNEEISQNSSINQFKHLLKVHHQGFNKQVVLNMQNADFCARACILQIHGPKPSCASFDFVLEDNNSTRRQYCLLNSQSLLSLKRRKKVEKQILYAEKNIHYWHYEPRESLIIPADMNDDDRLIQILENNSLVKQFAEPTICQYGSETNFDALSSIVALVGTISGSILGIKLAKLVIRHRDIDDEMKYGSRMVRLVHRLSGLSIDGRHLQNEVRM